MPSLCIVTYMGRRKVIRDIVTAEPRLIFCFAARVVL